jgi:poly(A) polymerase
MKNHCSIIHQIEHAGYEAFFVGGCVRDFLLGRPSKDIDINTSATPDQIVAIFPDSKLVGKKFGVTLVTYGDLNAEVATYRLDGAYSDGRHPDAVKFTTDVTEDVTRRDFTVNAMLMDAYGFAHDVAPPYIGKDDLQAKVIRCVGDPYKRLAEDPLRMLRAIRFASKLGFQIEPDTFEAIEKLHGLITLISPERITDELVGILTSGQAGFGFKLLERSGLMTHILPEIEVLSACPQDPKHHPEGDVLVHTYRLLDQLPAGCSVTLALAALLHDIGKPGTLAFKEDGQPTAFGHDELGATMAENVLRRMKCSNEIIETVVQLVDQHMRFRVVDEMKKSKLMRFLRQPNFAELLELHRMDALAGRGNLTHYDLCVEKLQELPEEVLRPVRLLTGDDLIEMGLKPGPVFKEVLAAVEDRQLDGTVTTKQEALDAAYGLCWHETGVKNDPGYGKRMKEAVIVG